MDELSSIACRVLGSLLEKELTVPATYPMTLNSVVSSCNQMSGRDPILHVADADVTGAVEELRAAGLVRLVHPSHGARSVKYRQVADDVLGLDGPGRAVLTVLMLRGPQTPGELRTRGERLHPFASVDEVDHALDRLAERPEPLVELLDRRPGQKEARWAHRLAGEPAADASPGIGGPTATAPSAPSAPAATTAPIVVPAELTALAPFVGAWIGAGHGTYPTIAAFGYVEEIDLRPVPGKPMLAYRSSTRSRDDGRALHGESGFWRLVGAESVELVLAHGSGVVEVAEGVVEGGDLIVATTQVARSSTAKEVSAVERRYRVDGDTFTYELSMAAVGQPLLPHLSATLGRPV
jgi:uncharacterized protein YceH (UPF0502 family)